MLSNLSRAGVCLALVLSLNTPMQADDPITPIEPAPHVSPVPLAPAPTPAPVPAPAVPHGPAPIPGFGGAPVGPSWAPGGDPISGMRVGRPYYWSATVGPAAGYGPTAAFAGPGGAPCGCGGWDLAYGYGGTGYSGGAAYYAGWGAFGAADPYTYHFGPGYYRHSNAGHYRFPWYSYRRPWYYPGHPSFNRDTNLPW